MTSRTPIRLTHYRGPLATPSTSPESSPTLSTPPTAISRCSTAVRPTLDVAILQHRISTLSPPTRQEFQSGRHRRGRRFTKQGLFDRSTRLSLIFESLIYSAFDLANTLAGIVAFCLLILGLLEWSSHTSELPRRPNPQPSIPQFPLLPRARALGVRVNPSLYEPRDQHVAVLQFFSEQIQHAKALSSLTISLGLPLRAFFEAHRATIPKVMVRHNFSELPHPLQEVNILTSLTQLLESPLLDLTPGSFIGRSFALALDELGDLISEPMTSHGYPTYGEHPDAHLHAIYWRITSNLLLEYSAARPRARRLMLYVRALHQQLSPIVSGQLAVESIVGRSTIWKGVFRHPAEDGMQAFVTGLEITLDNVHQLIAYLDWITEQLAQTTLTDVLKTHHRTDFSSCLMSLQELFILSKPSTPKKICLCLNDHGVRPPSRPEKVDIVVPGSPTVRAGR